MITVARVRPARPCSARRTNGQPCRAFAIVGGRVCRAHGGAAGQVRRAARLRVVEGQFRRAFDLAWARHQVELREWQADRIVAVAELLDIPVEQVTPAAIGCCTALHGVPEPIEAAPQLRVDGRRGPRPRRPA